MAESALPTVLTSFSVPFPLGCVTVRVTALGRVAEIGFGPAGSRPMGGSANPVACALRRYLAGRAPAFSPPVVGLSRFSFFDRAVWKATRAIPPGQTRTYGEIAAAIGRPGAARAVGGALGRNPVPLAIPCHRVIAAASSGGFSSGVAIKEWLLALEGRRTPGDAGKKR